MRPDLEARIGSGLALLESRVCADAGKVFAGCSRGSDYYLWLIFYPCFAAPFLLLAVAMINPIASGNWSARLLFGILFLALMAGVVGLLNEFFMLARDGFRRVCFDLEAGNIKIDHGGFDHLISRYEILRFADVAGLRLNHFSYRSGKKHVDGYEGLLIMQDGAVHVVFPLLKTYEQAIESARQLSAATGLPVIGH
ncbi:MAG: hypothetical protein KKB51_24760 [Candidatus Riflebacteria bacterium]|nr:hypothetical protein [Candidatus Riflebacteria bacterium]